MRKIAVVLAFVASHAYADLAFKSDEMELQLKSQKCTHPKVLALLKDEWLPRFQQGQMTYRGKPLQMCWVVTRPGYIAVVDEDGDSAEIPVGVFKQVGAI